MKRTEPGMRPVMNAIGGALIINVLLIQTFGTLPSIIESSLPFSADWQYAISESLYIFIYMFSFMIPVAFFRLFMGKYEIQPMRLNIKTGKDTPLMILGCMGIVTAAGLINSLLFSWTDFSALYGEMYFDKPFEFLLSFVATAIVPAVCEEFLYRGCVLSNMLPYGKTTAIIGSALMFSMMHSNYPQYLYTFCAGIVMALIYTETGSIWPGMLLHLFNNFNSVLYYYLDSSSDSATATAIYTVLELVLLLSGALSIILLIFRNGGKVKSEYTGAVPTFVGRPDRGPIKSIMSVTVIIFICLSVTLATAVLLMTFYY